MRTRVFPIVAAAVALGFLLHVSSVAQAPANRGPRTVDGKPDLNGIWQALNKANWDIETLDAARNGSRRGRHAAISASGRREKEGKFRQSLDGRSRIEMLSAGCAASDLHALSLPNSPGLELRYDRL